LTDDVAWANFTVFVCGGGAMPWKKIYINHKPYAYKKANSYIFQYGVFG
jgi:hypothetical protein